MRKYLLGLFALLLVENCSFACAQKTTSPRLFRLDELFTQVYEKIGPPMAYLCPPTGVYYKRPFCPGGFPREVYRRSVNGHNYEIMPMYYEDESISRLHPPLRLEEIDVESDQALSPRTMLNEFPELLVYFSQASDVRFDSLSEGGKIEVFRRNTNVAVNFTWYSHATGFKAVTSLDTPATSFTIWSTARTPMREPLEAGEIQSLGNWPQ